MNVAGTIPERTGSCEEAQTSPHSSLEHQRKRLSFFGRSSSDASSHRRALTSLNATMAPAKGGSDLLNPSSSRPSRPSTALSQNRRKTTDPLDAIRKSLFGFGTRKKAPANDQVNPPRPGSSRRPASRGSLSSERTNASLLPFTSPSKKKKVQEQQDPPLQFNTEEQYYQHRKKSSISRPFNFQHLTHTAKKHLPQLQTVDERNLTAKFWAVNAYQKPKDELKEIKADDLSDAVQTEPTELEAEGSCLSQATTDVASSLDETTFDETQETKFNPDAFETIHEARPVPLPTVKHYSSMSILTSPTYKDPETLRHVIKERAAREGGGPPGPQRAATTSDVRASLPVRPAPLPESLSENRPIGQSLRENQPLPPVPARAMRKIPSKGSLRSTSGSLGQLFPAPPGYTRASSAAGSVAGSVAGSCVSKRSSKSVATVNSRTDVLSEPTWEDDIDFAFDQEAEASCDFDWENTSALREEDEDALTPSGNPTPEDDDSPSGGPGGVRLSAWLGDAPSVSSSRSPVLRSGESPSASSENVQHKRGSSVGHRGFQAARTLSNDTVVQVPPPIAINLAVSTSGSPAHSMKSSLIECEKSPYTAGEMSFPGFDSSRYPEYLSDPESSSRSSGRRKSSSTNSYESSGRSLQMGSETTRWSSASASSIPDLLHSRRKSRSSVRKSCRMSHQLESVTSADEDDGESLPEPRPQWTRTQTDPLIMRRPSNSGDRTLLISSGRTVQRGRSATPPSRIALADSALEVPASGETRTGWI